MAAVMEDFPDTTATPPLTDETAAVVASFDPNILVEFLTDLAVVTLNASRDDLQVSLLSFPDTLQRCARFAADTNQNAIYLKKDTGDSTSQNGKRTRRFPQLLTFQGQAHHLSFIIFLQNFRRARAQSRLWQS